MAIFLAFGAAATTQDVTEASNFGAPSQGVIETPSLADSLIQPIPISTVPSDSRLWLRTIDSQSGTRASLLVRFPDSQPAQLPLVFDCEVLSESVNGQVIVSLEVYDETETPIFFSHLRFWAEAGLKQCQFRWEQPTIPDGTYRAVFDLLREGSGMVLATTTVSVERLTRSAVESTFAGAGAKLAAIQGHVREKNVDIAARPLLNARLAIADEILTQTDPTSSDWRATAAKARYVNRTVDNVRARLTFTPPDESRPESATFPIQVGNGMFLANNRPVLLTGVQGTNFTPQDADRLADFGLNYVVMAGSVQSQAPFLEAARRRGISVTYLRDPAMSGEMTIPAAPEQLPAFGVTTALQAGTSGLNADLELLRSFENVNSLSLVTAPKFMFSGDNVRSGFIRWLTGKYEDRTELNRTWRTRYFNFDEVQIWWDQTRWPYQYDWQTFHRILGDEVFTGLRDAAASRAPSLPNFVTLDGDFFTAGETRYGIDRETIAALYPIQAFIYETNFAHAKFARAYPADILETVLRRSLNPSTPIVELVNYSLREEDRLSPQLRRAVRSAVWDSAIEGANAFVVQGWHAGPQASPNILEEADALDGLATATNELNRFAEIVTAFQQAPAPVAILISESARIYEGGTDHLASVIEAYEGCSYSGYKVRFITEAQLEARALEDVEAMVLPNTPSLRDESFAMLQELTQTSMVFARTGRPIPYDAWGRSRLDVISFSIDSLLVRDDSPGEYMHAMEAAVVSGRLPEPPRATNLYGYTLEGVRVRSVAFNGRTYVYVMNLRKDDVIAHLAGPFQAGTDLLAEREVAFPMPLQSLQPYLIEMHVQAPAIPGMDAIEPNDQAGSPVGIVMPVEIPTEYEE